MRAALKEPAKSQSMKLEQFTYNASSWEAGVQGAKTEINALGKAGSA